MDQSFHDMKAASLQESAISHTYRHTSLGSFRSKLSHTGLENELCSLAHDRDLHSCFLLKLQRMEPPDLSVFKSSLLDYGNNNQRREWERSVGILQ
jgi:hypothetical protein